MEKMTSENCGPGCDCGKPSGNNKLKAVVCLIVLVAVGGIFAYKAKSANQATPVHTETAFAAPIVNGIGEQQQNAPVQAVEVKEAVPPVDKEEPVVKTVEAKKGAGELLDSLAALNTVAVNQDAVLVYLPAKGSDSVDKETTDAIASAQQKIAKATGATLGLYTLKIDSPEYANLTAQLPLPGMLVMSKGRGMGAVSGGITEEKILQAFIASSRAGGCGPSGCGPADDCN